MKKLLPILFAVFPLWAGASTLTVFSTAEDKLISEDQMREQIKKSHFLVFGEYHGTPGHHANQKRVLEKLSVGERKAITVSLEFISWMHDDLLQDFLNDKLPEKDFLAQIKWGQTPFSFYKPLLHLGHASRGAYGVNAPRELTRKISKKGIKGLSKDERDQLPPNFQLGQETYYQRFKKAMKGGGHELPEESLKNYFAAQSVWDDTMAFWMPKDLNYLNVIIVGNFHVEYGLGLPYRIQQRAPRTAIVTTIVQLKGAPRKLAPDKEFGNIADFVMFEENK